MIRFKDISIPKPCSVDYDALPGNELTRFCGSCEKHVYDFRGKDEAFLNEIYKSHGNVCGVFLMKQIKDSINPNKHTYIKSILTKFISLLLFLKTTSSFSAETNIKIEPISSSQLDIQYDSIPIKAIIKSKSTYTYQYNIKIYVDNVLLLSNPKIIDGFIYLPDTIQNDQTIKIKVFKRASIRRRIRIKPKTYHFKFEHAKEVQLVINYKKYIFRIGDKKSGIRRPISNQIMGLMK
ncbi:hypothetical protein [uncultured Cytophaga sp.]|uniref:hypothetical protein n=1 Tax=uncultured Cytophaga sp. TaxID=160238 RepID=UPI002602FA0B|nr:hypothetical protein [uncultured Cytophaga sp.]